jgi:hypothetical protein
VGSVGEITDDSEMAIMMIQSILKHGSYSQDLVRKSYHRWRNAGPEDIGITICGALDGKRIKNPQQPGKRSSDAYHSNGILGCKLSTPALSSFPTSTRQHPHTPRPAGDCNRLFVFASALPSAKGGAPRGLLLPC